MAHYSHVIYACYQKTCQNMPQNVPRVNLRQITLLRGYIHSNEQPVVLIPDIFVISLDIDDFTFIVHAQKCQSESL